MIDTTIEIGKLLPCLLCGDPQGSHNGGDYDDSPCFETLTSVIRVVDAYREGLPPGACTMTMLVKVKNHKLVSVAVKYRDDQCHAKRRK